MKREIIVCDICGTELAGAACAGTAGKVVLRNGGVVRMKAEVAGAELCRVCLYKTISELMVVARRAKGAAR
jgi:hypothetical protein